MIHDARNAKVFDGIQLKTTPAIAVFNFPPIKENAKLQGNIYLINSDIDYSVRAILNFVNSRTKMDVKEKMGLLDWGVVLLLMGAIGIASYCMQKYKKWLIEILGHLQGLIKNRKVWIFGFSGVFIIFMGCIIFVILNGSPAMGEADDIISMIVSEQNDYQYGVEGLVASGLMLCTGFMLVTLVLVLRKRGLGSSMKCRVGGVVLLLFLGLYYLLIQLYTYKTPWHATQELLPPSSYIRGPITNDHGITI